MAVDRMALDQARWPGELRPYQRTAIDRLAASWDRGRRRAWVVLPPGTGKTLVGLEAARRLNRRTVVFVPNTAIQHQWVEHWRRCGGRAGTSRELAAEVTVLTYQSLAIFDPDAEIDEEGRQRGPAGRLHENGRALVAALRAAGPLTLVLDECHHLLDVWGRLLAEVLDDLPGAMVVGLTATPPGSLTPEEARLVDLLFGVPILGASIPAMVRRGYLAPFTELAWLVRPTAVEADYVSGEAERFAELTTDLLEPRFATTGFLTWLDARLVSRTVSGRSPAARPDRPGEPGGTASGDPLAWDAIQRDEPALAAAGLRLHHAGLLALPPGARLREEHRRAPAAEDWVALLNDYVKHCLLPSGAARDASAVEAIRKALPAVGYQLTRRGIRSARSPVDRVLARSAAKTQGCVEIIAAEADSLGERLRCLVLCDHERAGATLPARLREVLDAQAGSAWLMLESLSGDPRTRPLNPMLVTGRTVAAPTETAEAFLAGTDVPGLSAEPAGGGISLITGRWSSRRWVREVTAFFEAGSCQVLVGTRALLGEGWDARGVNTLVDLTTATTATSVVQTRGRALRLDPSWPEKTANTWTVVCVCEDHPKGAADWARFVRKHAGYLVAAADGEIVSGVAHVDPSFSPYAPPPVSRFDALNATMLGRARDRTATAGSWRRGEQFRDELVHTLRIRPARAAPSPVQQPVAAAPEPPAFLPAASCAEPAPPPPRRTGRAVLSCSAPLLGSAVALTIAGAYAGPRGLWIAALLTALPALAGLGLLVRIVGEATAAPWAGGRAAALLDTVTVRPSAVPFALAVADGLLDVGLSRLGAGAVQIRPEPDGSHRFSLRDVDTATSELFASALDEVLAPVGNPRWVIPRHIVEPRQGRERRLRARDWRRGAARADGVVYHGVPAVFGQNRARCEAFQQAWNTWVSRGQAVYASSAEGAGIMATHRGEDPFDAQTVLRLAWD